MQPQSILATLVLVAVPVMADGSHKHLHAARVDVSNNHSEQSLKGKVTFAGCYNSKGNMTTVTANLLTSGSCKDACKGYVTFGMDPVTCYCGWAYPPASSKVDDSKCKIGCPFFPQDSCGGSGTYAIYNPGIEPNPAVLAKGDGSNDLAGSSTSSTDSSSVAPIRTVQVTHTEGPSGSSTPESNGSPNTVAIAVGVVVGVVGVAAIIGAVLFFVRRRRNAQLEEEHRRNAAVNAFISGSKPPSTSGGLSMTDARLDPVAVHRRLSDGSIADSEDYSRRILRVTNA